MCIRRCQNSVSHNTAEEMHNVSFFMTRRVLNAAEMESAPWTCITTCAVLWNVSLSSLLWHWRCALMCVHNRLDAVAKQPSYRLVGPVPTAEATSYLMHWHRLQNTAKIGHYAPRQLWGNSVGKHCTPWRITNKWKVPCNWKLHDKNTSSTRSILDKASDRKQWKKSLLETSA